MRPEDPRPGRRAEVTARPHPAVSRLLSLAGALALLFTFPGCIYRGSAVDLSPASLREPGWVSASGVVFQGQQGLKDCGPAALAMVLTSQRSPASTADVAAACPADDRGGVGAGQLRDYARQRGYSAFLVRGELSDLEKELSKGRPVIVGLLKPTTRQPIAHYEVVVGLNRDRALVATVDPASGWRRNSVAGFLAEWDPTERLMLVILPPAAVAQ